MTKLSPDTLMTAKEVAEFWRISVRTLKRQIAKGTVRLPPHMMRPFLRWRRADVERDAATASYSKDTVEMDRLSRSTERRRRDRTAS